MNVLFNHFITQQGRHFVRVEAGLVAVKKLGHSAGNLLAQGQDGNAHGAGALAFAAACSSSNDEDTPPSGDSAESITHKFGATELPKDPQRIVSVGYNDQDAILALGGTLVGTFDWYGDYPYGVWPWAHLLLDAATTEMIMLDPLPVTY